LVRAWVESQQGTNSFFEVYVNTPLEICVSRDPKGLYRQAIEGKIKNFTGISDPYEAPESPDLELNTVESSPDQLARSVVEFLQRKKVLP
jgi:adenylylsulfate kinase-like enzyme